MVNNMVFDVHFELAAAAFLMLAAVAFYRQKHIDIYRNHAFLALLVFVVISTVLDVATGIIASGQITLPYIYKYFFEMSYMIMHLLTAYLYFFYVITVTKKIQLLLKKKWVVGFPALLGILMILTDPWTKLVFYYDEGGVYQHGPGYLLFCVVVLIYIVIPAVYALYLYSCSKRQELLWLFSVSVLVTMGGVAQYLWFSHVLVVYVVNSLVIFATYLFQQNSDYYVDETTGMFKMHGFEEVLRERMLYEKKTVVLLMRVINYTSMTEIYDDERLSLVKSEMAKKMYQLYPKMTFYRVSASSYAIITDDEKEAKNVYDVLNQQLPKKWLVHQERILHEYSFYIVDCPKDCSDFEELMQRISYAKSDHPGHHKPGELICLSHDTVESSVNKQRISDLLEEVLMDNSIEIHFQPIYNVEKQKVTSVEVLARLKDAEKKYINPELFIHVAEESRTIIPLGRMIYKKACMYASQNHIFDLGIEDININLSPVQCSYEGLTEELVQIAEQYDIPMSRLHLEITESGMMNQSMIAHTLESLSRAGAKIALDDFGTGYSSLISIMDLPIDYVKIDKSLLWSYSDGKDKYLDALLPMIHAEGKKIIVEGVETEEQIQIVKGLQGDYMQGYYYSRPLSGDDFLHFLLQINRKKDK